MKVLRDAVFYAVLALATVTMLAAVLVIFLYTPAERTMGIAQKIFYFHAPSGYSMYLGAGACFLGSAAYIIKPTDLRDAFATAGAEAAVVFGLMLLITGPLWGYKAWGTYWTWDPRLTTSLLSVLIYVSYVLMRMFAGDGEAERKFSAALGVVGAANLPIIHFSVQKWSGQHPRVITSGGGGLAPSMYPALILGFTTFTLFAIALILVRTRIHFTRVRLRHAEEFAFVLEPENVR